MNQQALFSRYPASRASDPESSHLAEDEINRSGERGKQQAVVLEWLRRFPGLTSHELADRAGMDRYIFGRRLPDLVPLDARRGEQRRCAISGRKAVTWWPRTIESNGTR